MQIVLIIKFLLAFAPMLKDLWDMFKKSTKEDPQEFANELHVAMAVLMKPSTVEEKQNAAKKLQDLIRNG
jgi:hypothetical protein